MPQDTYVELPNGSYVEIPPNATKEQLSLLKSRIRSSFPQKSAVSPAKVSTATSKPSDNYWESILRDAVSGLVPGKLASDFLSSASKTLKQRGEADQRRALVLAGKGKPYGSSIAGSGLYRTGADVLNLASGILSPSGLAQIAATYFVPEVMLPYFAVTGFNEALEPARPGESQADALQRRLLGASQALSSLAGGSSETLRGRAAKHMETVGNVPESVVKPVLRSLTGSGDEAIRRYEERYAPKLEEARKEYAKRLAQRDEKVQQARQKYDQKVQEDLEKARAKHAFDSAAARKEYLEKSHKAIEARKLVERRAALEDAKDTISRKAIADTKTLYRSVKGNLDARWDALRTKIGVNTPVDMAPVSDAIDKAITSDLRGEPGNISIFKRMLQEIPEEEVPQEVEQVVAKANNLLSYGMKREDIVSALRSQYPAKQVERIAPLIGTAPGEAAPEMTFEGARIRYTALGKKMASEQLPGNVYRALAGVRRALGEVLNKTAEKHGAGAEYEKLLNDWKDFSYDWRGYTPGKSARESVREGGSPLYRLFKSEDPNTAWKILTGDAKERLIRQLKKNSPKGNIGEYAALAGRIQKKFGELSKPSAASQISPLPPEIPAFVPPKVSPFVEPPRLPEFEPPKKLTHEEIRRERIQHMQDYLAYRRMLETVFGLAEITHGKLMEPAIIIAGLEGLVRLLSKPALRDWIAKD